MSSASETRRDQNADPERYEPREIPVVHLAPSSETYGTRSKDTSFILECRGADNRRVGTGSEPEFSLREVVRNYHTSAMMRPSPRSVKNRQGLSSIAIRIFKFTL